VATVAFIKPPTPIDASLPLSQQIQIINLPTSWNVQGTGSRAQDDTSHFGVLHSIVSSALTPYLNAACEELVDDSTTSTKGDNDQRVGLPDARRRLAELELTLLQLQQNVEIPQVILPLHPEIQAAIDRATSLGEEPSVDHIPREVLADNDFVNKLQSIVIGWQKSINGTIATERDSRTGTAAQEINFWLDKEDVLHDVKAKMQLSGVKLTVAVLRLLGRAVVAANLTQDTLLKETIELVQAYNQLMRGFPLQELLVAVSLESVCDALNLIFDHVNKIFPRNPYPSKRAIDLLEAVSSDLDGRVRSLLKGGHLVHMDADQFASIMTTTKKIWDTWAKHARQFDVAGREHRNKFKKDTGSYFRIAPRHAATRERLDYVAIFRTNHTQLHATVGNVLGNQATSGSPHAGVVQSRGQLTNFDAVKDVENAYLSIGEIDVLDTTPDGNRVWRAAEDQYNERIARVENAIISILRDRLDVAKSANEMFQVCSRFNALFIRPKIRGAIAEYQTRLLDRVQQDIAVLEKRYQQQYGHSQSYVMAQLRDLPPVAGSIIWAKTIERQLDSYLQKVEDVLGPAWEQHMSGRAVLAETSRLRAQLDTMPIFRAWEKDVSQRDLSVRGRLFSIGKIRGSEDELQMSVNFDSRIITLFKEVRNFRSLGFNVLTQLSKVSKDAREVYPYVVTLVETLRIYTQVTAVIESAQSSSFLLDDHHALVIALLQEAVPLRWSTFANASDFRNNTSQSNLKHDKVILRLSNAIFTLQKKARIVKLSHDVIQDSLTRLRTCPFDEKAFQSELSTMQICLNTIEAEHFASYNDFVAKLNSDIQYALLGRLQHALNVWTIAFGTGTLPDVNDFSDTLAKSQDIDAERLEKQLTKPLLHEIRIQNRLIYVEPPLQTARVTWLEHLQKVIAIVCDTRCLRPSQGDTRHASSSVLEDKTFALILDDCTAQTMSIYNAINAKMLEVNNYVTTWLRFQALWDLQVETVPAFLGEDLSKWHQLLMDIRTTRAAFEIRDSVKHFGPISINFEQVLQKVNARYDTLQNELLKTFAAKVGMRISDALGAIEQTRKDLEGNTLEIASTLRAVKFITLVQTAKARAQAWKEEVELLHHGHTMLTRQRFPVYKDWVHIDQVEHEFNALTELLDRQTRTINNQSDSLRTKIQAEDEIVRQRTQDLLAQWSNDKPMSGAIDPQQATSILAIFEARTRALSTEADLLQNAKEAVALTSSRDNHLGELLTEISDLQSVWASLSSVWSGLNDLREMPWTTVQPRKLRQALEKLLQMVKDMPSRMRQYQAFDYLQNLINQLLKANTIVADLRGDAIRERHWYLIMRTIRPGRTLTLRSMTLADVWDLQLVASDKAVRDVILQAQGELGLEEFLREMKETWQNYSLDLVVYQNKCRLIRGWDELLSKCSDNVNALAAMKHSPYYKEFEEEASSWEERLSRVHTMLDVWIEVQRHWVYLEAVFNGNADIRHLLPVESSRFQGVNTEFFGLMKKVQRSPVVLDVLNIGGVQQSLERLSDLLAKIQKALGDYLERERASFPRFYFVGDEDLLEIIGNSKDTSRIAKHLGKMFPGISALLMGDEQTIRGIRSPQGEEFLLVTEVSLAEGTRINQWLKNLESSMREALATLLADAVAEFNRLMGEDGGPISSLNDYLSRYPAQIAVLAGQAWWTAAVESALKQAGSSLTDLQSQHAAVLRQLAELLAGDLSVLSRKKCENLITEFVYQLGVIEKLMKHNVSTSDHHLWLLQMRYNYTHDGTPVNRLEVQMADASFSYGFEYLGVADRLVRTPLTDNCFLAMTQALSQQLGGSPYGPAGTGKTETVKALGLQLGRFVIVFNCDDTFDFLAMGRIFLGICQVGAWGCFDEFNRLQESILSAVSQQIQNIQLGLKQTIQNPQTQVELVGRQVSINTNIGLFITMNPGYAGRSNLPNNLKKLFRSAAMSKPDKELIAEVTLYSQGFNEARSLSKQIVPFFDACFKHMSDQAHYDFGLRALKSVLVSSGVLKRRAVSSSVEAEAQLMLRSLHETICPKLVGEDVSRLEIIEKDSFPDVLYVPAQLEALKKALRDVASEQNFTAGNRWVDKAIQLYQIQQVSHGIMVVGNSGCGKSCIWRSLLQALKLVDGIDGVYHIIEPKVMSKDALYGTIDSTTREWTDGLFTSILRKILDNMRGESTKRHWIVFDGDVDPEWIENLNSVLDDNRLLTLPNGERLVLPENVRLIFEVESLQYATPATVSRCGMVWFDDQLVTTEMLIKHHVGQLRSVTFDDIDDDSGYESAELGVRLDVQASVADVVMTKSDLIVAALTMAMSLDHIMTFTTQRAINSLFGLLTKTSRDISQYRSQSPDFPLLPTQLESIATKRLLLAMAWSFAGDCPLVQRQTLAKRLADAAALTLPPMDSDGSIIDFDVALPDGNWSAWSAKVPSVDIDTQAITQTDIVIPTLDTIRHEDLLYSWLAEHKPLILCGPPGSGKTMTLFSALRKLSNMEVVGLNFSSATSPDLLVKSLEQHCEYRKTLNGIVMSPRQLGQWLVVFCDEINLPKPDKYGTQHVIAFLRQIIEHNGFWRTSDKCWITLEHIQFVGACNPPRDAGRHALSLRFMRHSPIVMVDYPSRVSLRQIYSTFNTAALRAVPAARGYSSAITEAMIDLYLESQSRFTADIQPHYIYSPRELTRWVKGVYETIKALEHLDLDSLVRIWAHEALRLFQDRLIMEEERLWTTAAIKRIAGTHFPITDTEKSLGGPLLFSNWLSRHYIPVDRDQLREFVKARLRTFCEEEVDVPLILYDDSLDHILRIDRVFRQPQGHVILIGVSGSGKTTLSRFVAWMNGLKTFQVKVHRKYTAAMFDEDLRSVLRRCGTKDEKICFIMDESNVLDSAFLERMNTLLANAEVPGLFEGDEYATLLTACREGAQRQGLLLDTQEELYKWFTQQIVKNLHVVFTMNPPEGGLASRAATSPALFNRCVLNWFGDWTDKSLFQVGSELTNSMDLDRNDYIPPDFLPIAFQELNIPPTHREVVVNAMVYVHLSMHKVVGKLLAQQGRLTYVTPRHFLDFVAQYIKLYDQKREELEEEQRHLNVGLDKLKETVDEVRDLRKSLSTSKAQLQAKDAQANDKLQKMIVDQRRAEQTKATALEIARALAKQDAEIEERVRVVQADLARAEPAVLEAQKSVQNIKRQHLTELRSMPTPPGPVKLALEAVCTLLGHKVDNWKAIQAIVRRDDFIASIVMYDNEARMTPSHRARMRNDYLSLDDFTYERVNRASKACGPLVQWVQAQVEYSEILTSVEPLRAEVAQLEDQKLDTEAQNIAIGRKVAELEQSITAYKNEYAMLISETQNIKGDMARLQHKVDRSLQLLESLSSERRRWEEGSKAFETQIETVVGDTLVAAAFLAYAGLYDQQYRTAMLDDWTQHLAAAGIKHKAYTAITEYLSSADERLQWQQNSLPVDDLCTENAIMLKKHNRYPLIIDPTGRIVNFLQQQYRGRRLIVTSFLDDNFTKQLESALRFGGVILIQDAENLDPVINPVLNREYQKTGGRILIQLGKQDIDFSSKFELFLTTRDASARFTSDICSRTTFVNFTVTQSSLQSQSLDTTLKSERPDVYERRSNLVKIQGDFAVQVRHLEKSLLDALNASQGNILDDDALIDTLENVKKEVGDITIKVAETEGVMTEVEQIMLQYKIIAKSCSAIFAVLEHLRHVNHFYQFSLQYFLGIFEEVLVSIRKTASKVDYTTRVDRIVKSLFVATFQRTAFSMVQDDKMTLALLLAQAAPYELDRRLFDELLDDAQSFGDGRMHDDEQRLTVMQNVLSRPAIRDGQGDRSADMIINELIANENSTSDVVTMKQDQAQASGALWSAVVIKSLQADRLVPCIENFVTSLFSKDFFSTTQDLKNLVTTISPNTPIALVCTPGFDASFRVDALVTLRSVRCISIALGSSEALVSADKAITDASLSGSWVYLKNVHLALDWLQGLEKRLPGLRPHPDFRLWLSMEAIPTISVNLLRVSAIVMCEQPAGIRASMRDSLITASSQSQAAPVERARLYLLLALTHAIIAERLRYVPSLGWSKRWEFSDADFVFAAHVVDTWVGRTAKGRTNVDPAALPWEVIRALVVNAYAGKIDDERDAERLRRLVEAIVRVETYDDDFDVVSAVAAIDAGSGAEAVQAGTMMLLPASPGFAEHRAWVEALPERESPECLGLPRDAERVLLIEAGRKMLKNVKIVVDKLEEGEMLNV